MEQLKQQLLQVVNQSNLPLEAIYYIVKDFYRDVDDAYRQALQQQMTQARAAQEAALAQPNTEENKEEQE